MNFKFYNSGEVDKEYSYTSLEKQFIYLILKGSKLIFFAPLGVGVNEENQFVKFGEVTLCDLRF
jgi:hypothetical protein